MNLEIIKATPLNPVHSAPIVFIHGAYHAAWCWEEYYLPYFQARGFTCYAVSLRGHGASSGYDELFKNTTLNNYVNDIHQLLNKIGEKAILVGHSVGGAVAQKFTSQYGDLVAGIVLVSSVPPSGCLLDIINLAIRHPIWFFRLLTMNLRKDKSKAAPLFFSDSISLKKLKKYISLLQNDSIKTNLQTYIPIIRKGDIDDSIPVFVVGAKNDPIIMQRTIRRTAAFYNADYYILQGVSSHDVMLDVSWEMIADQIFVFISNKFL